MKRKDYIISINQIKFSLALLIIKNLNQILNEIGSHNAMQFSSEILLYAIPRFLWFSFSQFDKRMNTG